jgi:general secretion pathway protein G
MTHYKLFFPRVVCLCNYRSRDKANNKGFTLVELIVITAIVGILASMSIPVYNSYVLRAKNSRAMADVRTLSNEISAYSSDNGGNNPPNLSSIKRNGFKDPWNHDYVYSNIAGGGISLKDVFSNPYNIDFDIYSWGPDGVSATVAGVPATNDDIIRSFEGAFVGLR